MAAEEEMTPEELAEIQMGHTKELGKALGLGDEFIQDILERGQLAPIDRAEVLDDTGAHGLVLSIAQRIGGWLQERAEAGEDEPQQGAIIEAAVEIADQLDMDRLMTARLTGEMLEVFGAASNAAARGKTNGSPRVGTGSTGAKTKRSGSA